MAYCPNCAAVLDPAQKFCSRCGQPSPAFAPAPAQPVTGGDERPSSVIAGIVLLAISFAISIMSVANILISYPRAATPMFLTRSFGFDILWILFTIGLWQRQGWARFAILLLTLWSAGNLLYGVIRVASSGAAIYGFALPLGIAALHVGALVLLFRPDSNAWFKR
jgi:hypothetical protein